MDCGAKRPPQMRCHLPKHSGVILPASTAPSAQDRTLAPEDDVTFQAAAKPWHARATSPALIAALAISAIAALTLAGAWFFQMVLDIRPCPLCLEQRYAYYLAVPLGALVAWAAARHAPRGVLVAGLALLALAALANAWLGSYHAGVEWGFWQGPTECSGPVLDLGRAGSLLDNLDKVKVIRCDEVQWRFLGLSLAGYNVLISLAMAAIALWGIARTVAPPRHARA
jgi:disulfide bond formation protein DsbB